MFCRACNTKIKTQQSHCPNCGRPVNVSRTAAPTKTMPLTRSTAQEPTELELDEQVAPAKQRKTLERDRNEMNPGAGRERASGLSTKRVRETLAAEPELLEAGMRLHRDERMLTDGTYTTDVGDIDLLAVDDAGALVVVLIPDDDKDSELVSEILSRIGWVTKHIGEPGQEVRGLVLLRSEPEDLGYAAAAVASSVSFKTYRMSLVLEDFDI